MAACYELITVPEETRQIARVLEFPAKTAPHIDWNSIALLARELGAHFEVRSQKDSGVVITMFWAYAEAELEGLAPAAAGRS